MTAYMKKIHNEPVHKTHYLLFTILVQDKYPKETKPLKDVMPPFLRYITQFVSCMALRPLLHMSFLPSLKYEF